MTCQHCDKRIRRTPLGFEDDSGETYCPTSPTKEHRP
jgi:uncharacterized Zn finger protein (UPF0148 family)